MMSYEEFTQREAALESAPQAEREAFYAEILEKETAKTDVRMMAYFHAALLHYREGDFRAAREILEPFVIDYQSYAYRPEIIACFNLMGVAAYCERSYALARFYIHEGLKIARENHEISRYSYEYNNLAVTYLAQHEYERRWRPSARPNVICPIRTGKCTPTSTAICPRSAAIWTAWTKRRPR